MDSRSGDASSGSRSMESFTGKRQVEWLGENIKTSPSCHCGGIAALRTSWTDSNPGRRFYNCPKSGSSSSSSSGFNDPCKYWLWVDPPMCERSTKIIPGLLKNIRRKDAEIENARLKLQMAESDLRVAESKLLLAESKLKLIESKLVLVESKLKLIESRMKLFLRLSILGWVICFAVVCLLLF